MSGLNLGALAWPLRGDGDTETEVASDSSSGGHFVDVSLDEVSALAGRKKKKGRPRKSSRT